MTFKRSVVVVSLGLLSACGGGSGSGSSLECADNAVVAKGHYAVENNTYMDLSALDGAKQCVGLKEASAGAADVQLAWTWPRETPLDVRGYPEVIYGFKPWFDGSTSADLPAQVASLGSVRLRGDYELELGAGSDGMMAFDVFFTTSATKVGEALPNDAELMIWLERFGAVQPGGEHDIGPITVDGKTWSVTISDPAAWLEDGRAYVVFAPATPTLDTTAATSVTGTFDLELGHFVAALNAYAPYTVIPEVDYLADVELGVMPRTGEGRAILTDYRVDVTKAE